MSGPHVKLYSEKRGDQVVYEGIAGGPMLDYLAEHGPTWGIAEDQYLRMTGTFRIDGDWYAIDQDPGGASGYGADALNMRVCLCGHNATVHGVSEPGCAGRCLCDLCPDDTPNDCWCAGFKPPTAQQV